MTSVKRRINFTGRKRIPQNSIAISILPLKANEPPRANVSFEIDDLGFPPSAAVVLEAYQRSQGMRFDFGTVSAPVVPDELILDEIDPGDSVLFRLKIVDKDSQVGQLLGAANRLRPESDQGPDGKRSLFPVEQMDLGSEIWRARITPAGPVLQLNFRLPQLATQLMHDALIQGLVLPAALRFVLIEITNEAADDDDEEAPWRDDWLRYCAEELNVEGDPTDLPEEDRIGWVDDVVRKFSSSYDFAGRAKQQFSEATVPCN